MGKRILYQDWIVALGRDPEEPLDMATITAPKPTDLESLRTKQIREAVQQALARLPEEEREFIERFYYIGQGYREIVHKSGRAIHKLEALHKRAVRQLQKELAPFVIKMFGISSTDLSGTSTKSMSTNHISEESRPVCPVCCSADRAKIDQLIVERDRKTTWRPVIRVIKERFGIIIRTPQTLIGHEKYH